MKQFQASPNVNIYIKLLESFALIMRVGSLTKAEALSGISKATFSRQLQRLEERRAAPGAISQKNHPYRCREGL